MKINKSLFIICGQVGAGKTTTANIFGKMINAPVASLDSILKILLKDPSFVGKDKPPTMRELTLCYNVFSILADYVLSVNGSVIIDGVFSKEDHRRVVIDVAKKNKANYYVIYVNCPFDILKKRAEKRFRNGRGVGWKAHLKIKRIYEPLKKPYFEIDSSKNILIQLKEILKKN